MVVVIAILAAITIIAYNGITSRAKASALQYTLQQAATKLEIYKVDNGTYPPDQATVAGLVNAGSSTTLTYAVNNSTNPATYCLVATQGTSRSSVGSSSVTPSADGCVVNVVSNPAATNTTDWSAYGGAGGAASGAIDAVPVSGFPAATSYLTSWSAASTDGKGGVFYVNTPAMADVVYTISMFAQS